MEYDLNSVDYILETTRSVRKRLDLTRPVDKEVLMRCLDIAIQAPSGSNAQTWRWLVVTDEEKKKKIGEYYRKSFYEYIQPRTEAVTSGGSQNMSKLASSAMYLADHMGEVPTMVFACVEGKPRGNLGSASLYGSIIPAAWSLMLALRSRGIGASWTTLHLRYEKECNEILGIPENITTAALLPIAYFKGKTFKKAERTPVEDLTYWDTWGNNT